MNSQKDALFYRESLSLKRYFYSLENLDFVCLYRLLKPCYGLGFAANQLREALYHKFRPKRPFESALKAHKSG